MEPSEAHARVMAALIRESHALVEELDTLGPDDTVRRREIWERIRQVQNQIGEEIARQGFEP